MWLFTNFGFFSVVQKPEDQDLTIRARVATDLDLLRERYLPQLSRTKSHAGTDYPYRAKASHVDFSEALKQIASDIDYGNFKNEVARQVGTQRAHVYSEVWATLVKLENENKTSRRLESYAGVSLTSKSPNNDRTKGKLAYGGVVVDSRQRILMLEPSNHFGGYVWTFPKGGQEPGETPEQVALREVLEETGVVAKITERIPCEFPGTTSTTIFFLMKIVEDRGSFGSETAQVKWASFDEAEKLIAKTLTKEGRERDLSILAEVRKLLKAVKDK